MGGGITYIETDDGICYLHLLTDAFTHEIVGWTLSESLVAENTLQALNQAIAMFPEADFTRLTHTRTEGHNIVVIDIGQAQGNEYLH